MNLSPATRLSAAISALSAAVLLSGCALPASTSSRASAGGDAVKVMRYRTPGSTFPISAAVEVPAGASTVYLSGVVPPAISAGNFGDTEAQTVGILNIIDKQLQGMNMSLGDIVKMQVFLVGDPAKGSKMDFDGFMRGYTKFFGTAQQPSLPSRSAFQIAALANPGWYVEIEVMAVRGAAKP